MTSSQINSIVVDIQNVTGPIQYSGLGALYGASGNGGIDTPNEYIEATGLTLGQGLKPLNNTYPLAVTQMYPKVRETGVKMIARLNELMSGWPYNWPGLDTWLQEVEDVTVNITQTFRDEVFSLSVLNEPDTKLSRTNGTDHSPFMEDPKLNGTSLLEKVNFAWTQTVQLIKRIDPTLKVQGPNYEFYVPWMGDHREDQDKMRAFLKNAIATNTVPDYIGWHQLGPVVDWVGRSLKEYYRPLERELEIEERPIVIEEFGPCSVYSRQDFDGVPGSMIKYMADLERHQVLAGGMAIYSDSALVGNSLRYLPNNTLGPSGGYWFLKWYNDLRGQIVYTSPPTTRYIDDFYQSLDGISAFNNDTQIIQIIFGGTDDNADVEFINLGDTDLSGDVRVRLEQTQWEYDWSNPNSHVAKGGDVKYGVSVIFDKTFTTNSSGGLQVPVYSTARYDAYKLTIAPQNQNNFIRDPTFDKYEAEGGTVIDGQIITDQSQTLTASNSSYVSGLNLDTSSILFRVNASPIYPESDLLNSTNAPYNVIPYVMNVRYASFQQNSTHNVYVNNQSAGNTTYPQTPFRANQGMQFSSLRINLTQNGSNEVELRKGQGEAEIDYIELRPYYQTAYRPSQNDTLTFICDDCYNCSIVSDSGSYLGSTVPGRSPPFVSRVEVSVSFLIYKDGYQPQIISNNNNYPRSNGPLIPEDSNEPGYEPQSTDNDNDYPRFNPGGDRGGSGGRGGTPEGGGRGNLPGYASGVPNSNWWIWMVIGVGGLVVLGIIICIVCSCCKRRQRRWQQYKQQKQIQEQIQYQNMQNQMNRQQYQPYNQNQNSYNNFLNAQQQQYNYYNNQPGQNRANQNNQYNPWY